MGELVITAVGTDRSGIVGEFSGHVVAAGANLCDSRMVNLRGHFALIAMIEGTDGQLEAARAALRKNAAAMGLTFEFSQSAAAAARPGVGYRLKTYSMDQPGIVHKVTSFLRGEGVNIEELETHLESAPFMGTPVFTMEMRISVPKEIAARKLRTSLEELLDAINGDVDLEPA
jgi:glycine cleavage system transcriptional repressor